jgi:hypothetical protein
MVSISKSVVSIAVSIAKIQCNTQHKFYFRFTYLASMKKQLLVFFLCSLFISSARAQRTQTLFDTAWKFFRGDVIDGEKQNTNDGNWRAVELAM